MTFNEWWVANYGGNGDVADTAEQAWNAALDVAIKLCEDLETNDSYIIALCLEKLKND